MSQETIVVADDDGLITQMLSDFLQPRGFNVVVTKDGMQTSMAIRRTPPAAVLLDIMMPGGTGLDVLKRLKALARPKKIPVIVISAAADPAVRRQALELGANVFLPKPMKLDDVYAALCRLLGKTADPPPSKP